MSCGGDPSCGCGSEEIMEPVSKKSPPVAEGMTDCGDGSCGCGCADVSDDGTPEAEAEPCG